MITDTLWVRIKTIQNKVNGLVNYLDTNADKIDEEGARYISLTLQSIETNTGMCKLDFDTWVNIPASVSLLSGHRKP